MRATCQPSMHEHGLAEPFQVKAPIEQLKGNGFEVFEVGNASQFDWGIHVLHTNNEGTPSRCNVSNLLCCGKLAWFKRHEIWTFLHSFSLGTYKSAESRAYPCVVPVYKLGLICNLIASQLRIIDGLINVAESHLQPFTIYAIQTRKNWVNNVFSSRMILILDILLYGFAPSKFKFWTIVIGANLGIRNE